MPDRAARLHALSGRLAGTETPEAVAAVVVDHLVGVLASTAASVALRRGDSDELKLVASAGAPPRLSDALPSFSADAEIPFAEVVRTGEAVWLRSPEERIARFPGMAALHSRTGDVAWAVLPIVVGDRVLGAIGLSFSSTTALDDDARLYLETVAACTALAVENTRLNQAAHENEAQFRAVVEQSTDAIAVVEGTTSVYVNDAYLALVGVTDAADALGGAGEDWIHPDDRALVVERVLARQRGEAVPRVYQYRVVRTDGEVRTVEVAATAISRQGRPAALAVLRDVTERARAAAGLQLLAEASAVLGTSLDSETTIAAVARLAVPAIADWCVVDLAEPRGDGAFRLRRLSAVHADPAKQANMGELLARYPSLEPEVGHTARRVFESGESWLDPSVDEARFVAEARDAAHLELLRTLGFAGEIVVPLVARGQALGTITLVTGPGRRRYDQADRALAEELARRCAIALDNARLYAEARAAVQARDNFLGIAAHEMRTPITGLRGYAQLVIRQLDQDGRADPARVRRGLDEIERQSRRLTELMARLLDVARIETGKLAIEPRPTDLGALVEQVVENVRQMAPDRALSVRASGPIEASIDPLRFEQVIRNLLDNAVKFSPVNAPIEIELHSEADRTVTLAVRDHGLGVAPERRAELFERFHQAHGDGHAGGMGLGLYISREIVEQHGGRIWAEFPDDGGARFVVVLPMKSLTLT